MKELQGTFTAFGITISIFGKRGMKREFIKSHCLALRNTVWVTSYLKHRQWIHLFLTRMHGLKQFKFG